MEEFSVLVDGGRDDVAEGDERDDRRNYEEGDAAQSDDEAPTEVRGDFFLSAERARHLGQFRCGHRHAEQADGQKVERLRVSQRRYRAGREPARNDLIDVRASWTTPRLTKTGPKLRITM